MSNTHKAAYDSLTQVIESLSADRVDENTVLSLKGMLTLTAFAPIRTIIENKIIEIGNYLKAHKLQPEPKKQVVEVYMGKPTTATPPEYPWHDHEIINEFTKYMKDNYDSDCEFEVKIPECDQLR